MSTRSGKDYKEQDVLASKESQDHPPSSSGSACSSLGLQQAEQSHSRPVTRKLTDYWLVGHSSASIKGAKLPDCRQVMKYFFHIRHDPENVRNSVSNEEIAYRVADTVLVFWQMARIKTKLRQKCMLEVMNLWGEWDRLAKNKTRQTDPGNKRAIFQRKLDGLFDISAKDAIEEIMKCRLLTLEQKNDDVEFYLDQKGERMAYMDGHDKMFEKKAGRKEAPNNLPSV